MARPGKPTWYPRKNWSELKPATQKRHMRNGITRQSYYTKAGQAKVSASRGHANTPERPERAQRNPERYQVYISKRVREDPDTLRRQALARKRRFFAQRVKYSAKRAENLDHAPAVTMAKFLAMDENAAEDAASKVSIAQMGGVNTMVIDNVEYDVVDWEWLLYH